VEEYVEYPYAAEGGCCCDKGEKCEVGPGDEGISRSSTICSSSKSSPSADFQYWRSCPQLHGVRPVGVLHRSVYPRGTCCTFAPVIDCLNKT
jgi:hypothetical protein